jgi:hypothetical protein
VDEKMPIASGACQKISPEMQQLPNILWSGRPHARPLLDNIVKA